MDDVLQYNSNSNRKGNSNVLVKRRPGMGIRSSLGSPHEKSFLQVKTHTIIIWYLVRSSCVLFRYTDSKQYIILNSTVLLISTDNIFVALFGTCADDFTLLGFQNLNSCYFRMKERPCNAVLTRGFLARLSDAPSYCYEQKLR